MLDSIVHYINQNYGSKRGLLNATKCSLYAQIGGYAHLTKIEWQHVERLIFVCNGNICRSPLASVYAVESGMNSESFGLTCGDNHPADPRAVRFAKREGLDLSLHRTRNIKQYVPRRGDLLIGMEPAHEQCLRIYQSKGGAQVTLAGLWLKKPLPYIHDPYSSTSCYFDKCEETIVSSTDRIISLMRAR